MKLCKPKRCYPTEHLESGSKFDQTDPDYDDCAAFVLANEGKV